MMIDLHPTYTFRVVIQDRRSDNAGSLTWPTPNLRYFNLSAGKSGCDEVWSIIRDALARADVQNFSVQLEGFEFRG